MGDNVEKSLSVYGQRNKKNGKTCKETEELLPCSMTDVKKTGEHSWHTEWVNSNPGNIQSGSCKK